MHLKHKLEIFINKDSEILILGSFPSVKSMYRVYHKSQGFNWFKSWIYVFKYALYSKKKYKDVK